MLYFIDVWPHAKNIPKFYPVDHQTLHILRIHNVGKKIINIGTRVMMVHKHLVFVVFEGLGLTSFEIRVGIL